MELKKRFRYDFEVLHLNPPKYLNFRLGQLLYYLGYLVFVLAKSIEEHMSKNGFQLRIKQVTPGTDMTE